MASSKPNEVFDNTRKKWVSAQEEELVRQKLLHELIHELHFPKALILVEKTLKELPHLKGSSLPHRRIDVVCFANDIHPVHPLFPLLLIECKKEGEGALALEQLLGYNHHVGAYFVAVVEGGKTIFTSKTSSKELLFIPPYETLKTEARKMWHP